VNSSRLETRIQEMVSLLEMEEYADRRCEPFSKGMKQKVALGRSMIHDPGHLLLDEPTAGLDVMSARGVRQVIGRLRDEGRCVILSTHILQEAERLCDRLALIHRGRIVAAGSPEAVRQLAGKSTLEDAFVALVGEPAGEEGA
jgi:sodium transport system ATP-binding protein